MTATVVMTSAALSKKKSNTVLISFGSGVGHNQGVLIALAANLNFNKLWQGQHKFWKYVSPIRTFAWLPEQLARTYCSAGLGQAPRPYGEVHHLQGRVRFQALHGVPKHLSHRRHQKCPGTGGVPFACPGKG